jgi:beta-lactam-binding protein with PASTA domain
MVVGLRESVATRITEEIGLKPEITYGPDKEIREGFVYSQSVREGERVNDGDTLKIGVSTGP